MKRSCYRIKHQKRRNGRNHKARLCYAQRCKLLVSSMGKPLRKRQFDLEAIFKTLLRGGRRSLPKASRNICSSLVLSICGDIMFHPLLVSIRIPSPLEFGWKYWAHIKQLSGFHLLLQAALHCLPICAVMFKRSAGKKIKQCVRCEWASPATMINCCKVGKSITRDTPLWMIFWSWWQW